MARTGESMEPKRRATGCFKEYHCKMEETGEGRRRVKAGSWVSGSPAPREDKPSWQGSCPHGLGTFGQPAMTPGSSGLRRLEESRPGDFRSCEAQAWSIRDSLE